MSPFVVLSLVPVMIVGNLISWVLAPNHSSISERIALALALGSGAIALGLFYFSLLDSRYAMTLTIALVILVIAAYGGKFLAGSRHFPPSPYLQDKKIDRVIILATFLFLFTLSATVAITTDLGFDGLINWGFKAQAAFVQGGWASVYFTDPLKQFTHQDYPLLVPSLEAWAYSFMSRVDEHSLKVVFPLFYLCLLILFYGALRRRYSVRLCLLFVLLLGLTPYLASMAAPSGYADVPLMLYTFAAIVFIQRWMERAQNSDLVLGAILSALSVWVKREGIVYWLVNLAAIVVWLWVAKNRPARDRVRSFVVFLAPAAMILIPWFAFLAYYQVPASDFVLSISPTSWARLPVIAQNMLGQFFDFGLWGGLWVLFFVVSFSQWHSFRNAADLYVWLSAFVPLVLLELSFLFSVWDPFTDHLALASERLYLHEVPVVWYWLALQSAGLDDWLNQVTSLQFRENKTEKNVQA